MTCELPDILEVAGLDYLKKLLHTLYHVQMYHIILFVFKGTHRGKYYWYFKTHEM